MKRAGKGRSRAARAGGVARSGGAMIVSESRIRLCAPRQVQVTALLRIRVPTRSIVNLWAGSPLPRAPGARRGGARRNQARSLHRFTTRRDASWRSVVAKRRGEEERDPVSERASLDCVASWGGRLRVQEERYAALPAGLISLPRRCGAPGAQARSRGSAGGGSWFMSGSAGRGARRAGQHSSAIAPTMPSKNSVTPMPSSMRFQPGSSKGSGSPWFVRRTPRSSRAGSIHTNVPAAPALP